jgi:hypothetical protein
MSFNRHNHNQYFSYVFSLISHSDLPFLDTYSSLLSPSRPRERKFPLRFELKTKNFSLLLHPPAQYLFLSLSSPTCIARLLPNCTVIIKTYGSGYLQPDNLSRLSHLTRKTNYPKSKKKLTLRVSHCCISFNLSSARHFLLTFFFPSVSVLSFFPLYCNLPHWFRYLPTMCLM